MKNLLITFCLFTIFTTIYCCKSATDSPKGTVIEMGKAMKEFEFKNMLPFMCKENREKMEKILPEMEKFGGLMKGMLKTQMEKFNVTDKSKYEFVNENITGNTATLDIKNKLENKTNTLHFVREDNKWLFCEEMGNMGNAGTKFKNGISNLENKLDSTIKNMKPEDIQKGIEKAKQMLNDPKMQELMKNMNPEQLKKIKEGMQH